MGTRRREKLDSVDQVPVSEQKSFDEKLLAEIKKICQAQTRDIVEAMDSKLKTLSEANKIFEKSISILEEKVTKHTNSMTTVQAEVGDLAQYSRRNSIRVFGIPEAPGENTDDIIVTLLSSKLGINISPFDLDRSHRVGKVSKNKSRAIIVKFVSFKTKFSVLTSKSKLKGSKEFIVEDLTKYRLLVLRTAKEYFGKQFCWTFDGKIFIKINDVTHVVKQMKDLDNLMSMNPRMGQS